MPVLVTTDLVLILNTSHFTSPGTYRAGANLHRPKPQNDPGTKWEKWQHVFLCVYNIIQINLSAFAKIL